MLVFLAFFIFCFTLSFPLLLLIGRNGTFSEFLRPIDSFIDSFGLQSLAIMFLGILAFWLILFKKIHLNHIKKIEIINEKPWVVISKVTSIYEVCYWMDIKNQNIEEKITSDFLLSEIFNMIHLKLLGEEKYFKDVSKNNSKHQVEICRFIIDSIESCKRYYVGPHSHLMRLYRRGEQNLLDLDSDLKAIEKRIQTYLDKNHSPSEDLIVTKENLQFSIQEFKFHLIDLEKKISVLKNYFTQFDQYINLLSDTEEDLRIITQANKHILQSQSTIDLISIQSWKTIQEVSSHVFELGQNIEKISNDLVIERAIQQPTVDGLEQIIIQATEKISQIREPSLHL